MGRACSMQKTENKNKKKFCKNTKILFPETASRARESVKTKGTEIILKNCSKYAPS
jgi:hypothetical protein